MKRLLIGLVFGGFIMLIGGHLIHSTKDSDSTHCSICILNNCTAQHVANALPLTKTINVATGLVDIVLPVELKPLARQASARSPPIT